MVAVLSGCLEPSFHYEPQAADQNRLPFKAVVLLFKDNILEREPAPAPPGLQIR
jgi:hypothetical protein